MGLPLRKLLWNLVYAAMGGLLWLGLEGMEHYVLTRPFDEMDLRSITFGSMEHWPAIMRGYLPLDILVACFLGWFMYTMWLHERPATGSMAFWLEVERFLLSLAAGIGIMGVSVGGWYLGIELFIFGHLLLLLIAVAFFIVLAPCCYAFYRWELWHEARRAREQRHEEVSKESV